MTEKGYRANQLYTGSDYTLRDVVEGELFELGNDDIMEYLNQRFNLNLRTNDELMSEDDAAEEVEKIIEYIHSTMHIPFDEPLYAFWMCASPEHVKEYYLDHDDMELSEEQKIITEYDIPENTFIISDLDEGGQLRVSRLPLSSLSQSVID